MLEIFPESILIDLLNNLKCPDVCFLSPLKKKKSSVEEQICVKGESGGGVIQYILVSFCEMQVGM